MLHCFYGHPSHPSPPRLGLPRSVPGCGRLPRGLGLLVAFYQCHPRYRYATSGLGFLTVPNTYLSLLSCTTPATIAGSLSARLPPDPPSAPKTRGRTKAQDIPAPENAPSNGPSITLPFATSTAAWPTARRTTLPLVWPNWSLSVSSRPSLPRTYLAQAALLPTTVWLADHVCPPRPPSASLLARPGRRHTVVLSYCRTVILSYRQQGVGFGQTPAFCAAAVDWPAASSAAARRRHFSQTWT
jgi:hypothetical protein